MKKRVGIFIIIVIAAGVWYFTSLDKPAENTTVVTEEAQVQEISYEGVEGIDAMTLLKENYNIGTEEFGEGLGEFVTSIEGIEPNSDEFWAFLVNGETANVGASSYITKEGDLVEWKIEEIGEY